MGYQDTKCNIPQKILRYLVILGYTYLLTKFNVDDLLLYFTIWKKGINISKAYFLDKTTD
jgi:hypothetical protein